MNKSTDIKDLAIALAKAQAVITGAIKDSKNPFFKSSYADLESVWNAIRGPLTENGLSVIQTTEVREGSTGISTTGIVTTLLHSSGQWIDGFYPLTSIKQDPQSVGSAMTYARRYTLAAIVGVVQIDDDGEAAMARRALPGGHVPAHIQMEHPPEDVGFPKDVGYRIPFGKFAKRSLEEVDAMDLSVYVNYLEKKALKDGKEITGIVKEFIDRASEYLGALENRSFDETP